MGASGQTQKTSTKDIPAAGLIVDFQSGKAGSKASPGVRFASSITLVAGEQPSLAYISCPVNEFGDESGPAVALRSSGPTGNQKLKSRCQVKYVSGKTTIRLMVGTLVDYLHNIEEDSAVGIIADDKFLLSKVSVNGRMCYDPVSKKHWYDEASPCIFNRFGPDCIDSPKGPRFAPTWRYGFKQQYDTEDLTEPAVGKATTRARSWTVADALEYVRNFVYTGDGDKRPAMGDRGNNLVDPKSIQWDRAVASVTNSGRVVRNVDVDGLSVLRSLTILLRKAGAYELYMEPSGEYKSVLRVVNMAQTHGSPLALPGYASTDVGDLVTDANTILGGYIRESIYNYFDDLTLLGDPPVIETFVSTTTGEGANGLEPAWDTRDETAFKNYIKNNGNSRTAFEIATKIWPLVYCGYRIKKGFNPWAGTKWSKTMQAAPYFRILPTLLTGYQQSQTNPANWSPRDIVVEYRPNPLNPATNNTSWKPCLRYDSLTLSPDGKIVMLPALRDATIPQTWRVPFDKTQYSGEDMEKLDIRMTVAIEADWRLCVRAGVGADPNGTASRINQDAPKWSCVYIAEDLDYVEWLRKGSHPNGKAAIQASFDAFEDKCAENSELFTDRVNATTGRMVNHAGVQLIDLKRIEASGQFTLAAFNPSIRPGQCYTPEGPGNVVTTSVVKSVTFNVNTQMVTLEMGVSDNQTLYDVPQLAPYVDPTEREWGDAKTNKAQSTGNLLDKLMPGRDKGKSAGYAPAGTHQKEKVFSPEDE
jgi:hypothetical protein